MAIRKSSATLRPDLTQTVYEYDMEKLKDRYLCRKLFPIFKSATKTGEYPVFTQEVLHQPVNLDRNPTGGYNRIDAELESRTYGTRDRGQEFALDDEEANQYATYLDFLEAMGKVIWDRILAAHDVLAEAVIDGATMTNASTAWATLATGSVMADVATGLDTLSDRCGKPKEDMILVLPKADYDYAKDNTLILDRIKYTNPGVSNTNMTGAILAGLFGCKEVIRANAIKNSAGKKGAVTMEQLWPTSSAYIVAPVESESASLRSPGLGRTILWTEDSPTFPVTETYGSDEVRAEILRLRANTSIQMQTDDIDLFVYGINTAGA